MARGAQRTHRRAASAARNPAPASGRIGARRARSTGAACPHCGEPAVVGGLCNAQYQREYYERNKDKIAAGQREYYDRKKLDEKRSADRERAALLGKWRAAAPLRGSR